MSYVIALSAVVLCLAAFAVAVLARKVSYARGDTFSLLVMSVRIRGLSYRDMQHVIFWDAATPDPTAYRFGLLQKVPYAVFLRLLKLAPERHRLRWAQALNLVLLLLASGMLAGFVDHLLLTQVADGTARHLLSLAVAALFLLRARVLLVAMLGLTDVLNYLLLIGAISLLERLFATPEGGGGLLLGVVLGVAVRNRTQDLVLVAAVFASMVAHGTGATVLLACLSGVVLVNLDSQLHLLRTTGLAAHARAFLMQSKPAERTPASAQADRGRALKALVGRAWGCAGRLFNVYSAESLWPNLGAQMVMLPVSVVILLRAGAWTPILIFIVFYVAMTLGGAMLLRHRVFLREGDVSHCLFGGRQLLILYPVLLPFHALAVAQLLHEPLPGMLPLYAVLFVAIIAHQLYRYIDYLFSDRLHETKLVDHPVTPLPWSRELGERLRERQGAMVVLGSYLIFGEAEGAYHLDETLRLVDCYSPLDAQRLMAIIDEYRVTHVALTPHSCFGRHLFGMEGEVMDEAIARELGRLETVSPNLYLFKTRYA